LPANGGREKRGVSQWGRGKGELLGRGQRGNRIQNYQTRKGLEKKQGATSGSDITLYVVPYFCKFSAFLPLFRLDRK
jgi:hypothetical protein